MRDVLDSDSEFRERVASGVNEEDLDRASWLFLTRPEGWVDEYELLAEAWQESLRDQESNSAQRRLEQLEETAERTRRDLAAARDELESTTAQLADERETGSRLTEERDQLVAQVAELEEARSTVIRNLKVVEALSVERLARIRTLESALEEARASSETGKTDETGDATATTGDSATAGSTPTSPSAAIAPAIGSGDDDVHEQAEPSPWDEVDPQAVGQAVAQAATALAEVGSALAAAAAALGVASTAQRVDSGTPNPGSAAADQQLAAGQPADDNRAVISAGDNRSRDNRASDNRSGDNRAGDNKVRPEATTGSAAGSAAEASRPPRRSPVKLLRGALEGSREALDQLFAKPGMIVYVDGYNVTMEAWPQLNGADQRRSLIDMLGSLSARTKADFHVVFDGADDGRRPTVTTPLPVRVHFSHEDVEADDQILDFVASLPTDRPVTVVSSDSRVRTGARRLGANTADSSELLEYVRRPTG